MVRALAVALLLLPAISRAEAPLKLDGSRLVLEGTVPFEAGSDKLLPDADSQLAAVKGYLEAKSAITLLRVEGHTDGDGKPEKQQALSERRALAVARALVAKGVDCKRLVAVGFGAGKPVADDATPEGTSRNRRIEFVNAALRGRAIGGQPVDGGGKIAGDPCK